MPKSIDWKWPHTREDSTSLGLYSGIFGDYSFSELNDDQKTKTSRQLHRNPCHLAYDITKSLSDLETSKHTKNRQPISL